MGFFNEIVSETRRGAVSKTAPAAAPQETAPSPAPSAVPAPPAQEAHETAQGRAPEPAAAPPEIHPAAPSPAPGAAEDIPQPAPEAGAAEPKTEAPDTPAIDLTADAGAAGEAERRRAHEAAEARRRAEFDARQAEKQAARQKQLDRIAAMSDEDAAAAAVKRVGEDTEKLTRRNMKEAVCAHVQARCGEDTAFARRTMLPEKSMINCFQYIYRKAQEFAEQEMKDNGVKRAGAYGCDVPDGLCFQWAEDYFNADGVKEDHKDDEKFAPKPYAPSARRKAPDKAAKKSAGKAKPKAKAPAADSMGQISLM